MKSKQLLYISLGITMVSVLLVSCNVGGDSNYYTRGVGKYPGEPGEYFAPRLIEDHTTYRNVAKLRTAYHSSSYDYNLTAQLITDGLITSKEPEYINVSTQAGDLEKNEKEWFFDRKVDSQYRLRDLTTLFLQLDMFNWSTPLDSIRLRGSVTHSLTAQKGYEIVCYGSNDRIQWDIIGQEKGNGYLGIERPLRPMPAQANAPSRPQPTQMTRMINQVFKVDNTFNYQSYKIEMKMPSAMSWAFSDWDFYNKGELLTMTPSKFFTSAWMSAGTGSEWVYVDLGAPATFDKVNLYWVNKAIEGKIQVSDNAETWNDVANLPGGAEKLDAIVFNQPAKGRYVRVLMVKPENGNRYILSEMEVMGKGGLVVQPIPQPKIKNNLLSLSGGQWKLQRVTNVNAIGENISIEGFDTNDWIWATVPGTVLTSYWNAGALPDPNYADNQLQISESFFYSNFWYRNEFTIPSDFSGRQVFLNFDGINWKSNIFMNGHKIGKIDGAFMRGKFDVTELVIPGKTNVIAVEIIKNANFGAVKEQTAMSTDQNGGVLGADNPTFHSTVGWDWIPTIRGRNMGIWNDVFLTHTGAVTIENPFVHTVLPLPDTTIANVFVEVTLKNHLSEPVSGKLSGKYGNATFVQEVSLSAFEAKLINLDASTHPSLKLQNPKLWWPKGYGAPNLYDVELKFTANGKISDKTGFKSGVRQMTFNEDNSILNLFINGRRFIGFGGNWGFGESNLNYRGREYDVAVAYHADMNFTIIRNWVGQIGDEEFYEACDRHGIVVWQDFWLANPVDGPNPDDPDLFITNADDYVKRIRNHPSIGIYVGRNEGYPPPVIDNALREMLPKLHPGIHYISSSADEVVSGHGPYRALPPKNYFSLTGNTKFHSERGMPNVMPYESLVQTFNKDALWPQNKQWGLHDFTLGSAQSAASFNKLIEDGLGQPQNAKQFAEWAQWVNYNGYRAMFEGRSDYRQGLLLWMSHPAWPSMVWQTYDYYFEPTAAYFGCKKASEPLHIQWNQYDDQIEVVNYRAGNRISLIAKAQLINMDGTVQWEKEKSLNINEDFTLKCFNLEFPETLSSAHFVKLTLTENGKIVSDNFYWRGLEDGNYKALNQLPKVVLNNKTILKKSGDDWMLTTTLKNETNTPALMIRLKVIGSNSEERILPVFYSDNYFSLMPKEEKNITMRFSNKDTRGDKPKVDVSGFNL